MEIEKAYSDVESVVTKEENSQAIERIVAENALQIQALRDFFVAPGDEVGFIEKIEAVGKSSELIFEITSISQDKTSDDPVKEDIKVRIAVEGSWQSIMTFIKELERMPFGVIITNINIDANSEKGWAGFVEIIIFREKLK